jgi:hypothetical protein
MSSAPWIPIRLENEAEALTSTFSDCLCTMACLSINLPAIQTGSLSLNFPCAENTTFPYSLGVGEHGFCPEFWGRWVQTDDRAGVALYPLTLLGKRSVMWHLKDTGYIFVYSWFLGFSGSSYLIISCWLPLASHQFCLILHLLGLCFDTQYVSRNPTMSWKHLFDLEGPFFLF